MKGKVILIPAVECCITRREANVSCITDFLNKSLGVSCLIKWHRHKKWMWLTLAWLLISEFAYTQNDFLKMTDGRSLLVEIVDFTDSTVTFRIGGRRGSEETVKSKDVAFFEEHEKGMYFYSYNPKGHDINTPELQKRAEENPESLMKKGGKVYIPISSSNLNTSCGRLAMRQTLKSDYPDLWTIVDTEQEAEFILEFNLVESGRDKCFFRLTTREGNVFYISTKINTHHDRDQIAASKATAKKLCTIELPLIGYRLKYLKKHGKL